MDPREEPTTENRTNAAARFTTLCDPMPTELRQAWHTARMAMGITRATMLLEDTLAYRQDALDQQGAADIGG